MKEKMKGISLLILLMCLCFYSATPVFANDDEINAIELSFVDTPVNQAFEMLSTLGEVSIVLRNGVVGNVTARLYEKSIDSAIRTIANAAGYAVEKHSDSYIVMDREDVGLDSLGDMTAVRSFKVQYIDPGKAVKLLEKYLSRYGSISALEERKLIVVSDRPNFLMRIEQVLDEIDVEPKQILIEAEILEIALNDDETYGIDWSAKATDGTYGTSGLSSIGTTGFVMEYLTDDLDVFLQALSENDRVRTLSTPKLLVLEDQDAEVIIGDRIGFKVTTTIDSVTSESVEFIESGVILRVKAAVDSSERIMLNVHPEVSSGKVTDGIPSVSTTEVTTQLIADNGQPVFIGGLIKNSKTEREAGVPGLRSIPLVGALFSQTEDRYAKTETIVVIRPYLVNSEEYNDTRDEVERSERIGRDLKLEVAPQETSLDLNNAVYIDQDYSSEQSVDPDDRLREFEADNRMKKEQKGSSGLGWFLSVLTLIILL